MGVAKLPDASYEQVKELPAGRRPVCCTGRSWAASGATGACPELEGVARRRREASGRARGASGSRAAYTALYVTRLWWARS